VDRKVAAGPDPAVVVAQVIDIDGQIIDAGIRFVESP
jgi:hypothetical protein